MVWKILRHEYFVFEEKNAKFAKNTCFTLSLMINIFLLVLLPYHIWVTCFICLFSSSDWGSTHENVALEDNMYLRWYRLSYSDIYAYSFLESYIYWKEHILDRAEVLLSCNRYGTHVLMYFTIKFFHSLYREMESSIFLKILIRNLHRLWKKLNSTQQILYSNKNNKMKKCTIH